eukprot:1681920-Prymnesium_polylepis.2
MFCLAGWRGARRRRLRERRRRARRRPARRRPGPGAASARARPSQEQMRASRQGGLAWMARLAAPSSLNARTPARRRSAQKPQKAISISFW